MRPHRAPRRWRPPGARTLLAAVAPPRPRLVAGCPGASQAELAELGAARKPALVDLHQQLEIDPHAEEALDLEPSTTADLLETRALVPDHDGALRDARNHDGRFDHDEIAARALGEAVDPHRALIRHLLVRREHELLAHQ